MFRERKHAGNDGGLFPNENVSKPNENRPDDDDCVHTMHVTSDRDDGREEKIRQRTAGIRTGVRPKNVPDGITYGNRTNPRAARAAYTERAEFEPGHLRRTKGSDA